MVILCSDQNGTIQIRTYSDDKNVIIEVEDNGIGIQEENLNKIFDPFFTTKKVGEGTGLGLAISYGIIQEHNGTITAKSKVNHGTTFTVQIPAITK